MLLRHMIGYTPSLLVPALASFVAVFAYTRLLSPTEYGHYALALSSMNLLNAVFFFWLQVSLPRLMPQAIKEGKDAAFRSTAYAAYASVSAIVLVLGVPLLLFFPFGDFYNVALAAIPLALARSILNLNQSFHRSYLNFNRYNLIECGQAVAGLVAGLALVVLGNGGSLGANIGMVLGMVAMLFVDIKVLMKTSWKDVDPAIFKEIARFGAPLVASFGLGFVIASSDRYLIGFFEGAEEVGFYSAGYTLIDRILTMLFMAVVTPAFPLLVHRLEQEGVLEAQKQMRRNGVALFLLVLPACAGLILTDETLVEVLIGEEFRKGAVEVIPWIAIGSMLNGIGSHYLCHTFHLAKKPNMMFWIQIPVAIVNLSMNFLLIPQLGHIGAAYAMVASALLWAGLTFWIGKKAFPFPFPVKEICQISASVALMALAVLAVSFPLTPAGLIGQVLLGGSVYATGLLLFNVMDIRARLRFAALSFFGLFVKKS